MMTGGQQTAVALVFFATVGSGFVMIAKAVAKRIAGGGAAGREVDALHDEVEELRGELGSMRARLQSMDEMETRLDFAERMLAQVREKPALPGSR